MIQEEFDYDHVFDWVLKNSKFTYDYVVNPLRIDMVPD